MSVLSRAGAILDVLAESGRRLTVREIADATGSPRSSVHRVVTELVALRYLAPAPAGGFRLGPGLMRVAYGSQQQLVAPLRPALAALARTVDENVDLAVLDGSEVVIVDQIASSHRLQAVTRVGKVFPTHASCLGKALLASVPESTLTELLPAVMTAFTQHTVTDRDALLAEIAEVRRTGIAFDDEEHDLTISAAAVAIRRTGGITHAVSVVAPTARFRARRTAYVTALLDLRRTHDADTASDVRARNASTRAPVSPAVAAPNT